MQKVANVVLMTFLAICASQGCSTETATYRSVMSAEDTVDDKESPQTQPAVTVEDASNEKPKGTFEFFKPVPAVKKGPTTRPALSPLKVLDRVEPTTKPAKEPIKIDINIPEKGMPIIVDRQKPGDYEPIIDPREFE